MDYEDKHGFVLGDNFDEYGGFEYTIPDGFEAEIKNGKVIIRKKWSGDERIRKNILALVKKHAVNHERCQMEAYLEKQKEQKPSTPENIAATYQMGLAKGRNEQKPAEWSEEDEKMRQDAIQFIETGWTDNGKSHLIPWLKSLPERFNLQPKQEWSEEDDMLIDELKSYILYDKEFNDEQKFWRIKKLKSLRPQPNWKPSEEQMKCLEDCVKKARDIYNMSTGGYDAYPTLNSLYNELSKL